MLAGSFSMAMPLIHSCPVAPQAQQLVGMLAASASDASVVLSFI
jgi:hypothetical protein